MTSGLLGIAQASKLAGITEYTLRRMADRGIINCVKSAGGHRSFYADDIKRLAPVTLNDCKSKRYISVNDLVKQYQGNNNIRILDVITVSEWCSAIADYREPNAITYGNVIEEDTIYRGELIMYVGFDERYLDPPKYDLHVMGLKGLIKELPNPMITRLYQLKQESILFVMQTYFDGKGITEDIPTEIYCIVKDDTFKERLS